jgi:hypothetical protein
MMRGLTGTTGPAARLIPTIDGSALLALLVLLTALAIPAKAERFDAGRSHYLESCGGCHGIEGTASPRDIPELRGLVGRFMCSRAGREYIVRLPNVAFAHVDDRALSELLNFMVFELGGNSTLPETKPFTRSEVARLRLRPLKSASLEGVRLVALSDSIERCDMHRPR